MVREDEQHFLDNQFLRLGLAAIVAVCLLYGGYTLVSHALQRHQFERALENARALQSEQRHAEAYSEAEAALALRPQSPQALAVAAAIAQAIDSPDHLRLRIRHAQAEPESQPAKLKLAEVAVDHGSLDLAEETLQRVPPARRSHPGYLAAAAKLDAARGEFPAAREKLERAIAAAANPSRYQVMLARLIIHLGQPGAPAVIAELLDNPDLDPQLELDALRLGATDTRSPSALRLQFADSASAHQASALHDHLLLLDLIAEESAQSVAELARLFRRLGDPSVIHRAGLHALTLGLHDPLAAAVDGLPREQAESPHLLALQAAILAEGADWPQLLGLLKNSEWRQLDYLHSAYTALALRNTRGGVAWQSYWSEAVRKAAQSQASLDLMYETIDDWPSWETQTIDALWKFVRSGNNVSQALDSLYSRYLAMGDAGGLLKVVSAARDRDPDNHQLASEYARLCLLRRIHTERATLLAAEAYLADPESTDIAITQAFALTHRGEHERAVEIMQSLPRRALSDPLNAAYMAIVLARSGRLFDAVPYADIARRAQLLREEEELLP